MLPAVDALFVIASANTYIPKINGTFSCERKAKINYTLKLKFFRTKFRFVVVIVTTSFSFHQLASVYTRTSRCVHECVELRTACEILFLDAEDSKQIISYVLRMYT